MIRCRTRSLVCNEDGSSAVEFAILLPVLLAVLLGTVTLFDLFRTQQNVEKATFTVGDMLSREQVPITQSRIDGLLSFMRHTVNSASDGGLRISSISKKNGSLVLDWSHTSGTASFSSQPIPYDVIPDIAQGDSVILTESFVPHEAMVAGFGVDELVFSHRAVHRPRFLRSLAWK